jgi:hypothetical protein
MKDKYVDIMTAYLADAYKQCLLDSILVPRSVQPSGLSIYPLVAVAALVGYFDAMKKTLGHNTRWYSVCLPAIPVSMGSEPPFWDPITAAVWGGHDTILEYLLSMFASWFCSRKRSWTASHLRERLHNAMGTTIQADRPTALGILTCFHDEHSVCQGEESECPLRPIGPGFDGEESCLDRYAGLAAQYSSIDALRLLLHTHGFKSFGPLVFEKACRYGQLDFVRRALDKGMWYMPTGSVGGGDLREYAKYTGRDIAELLLDLGPSVRSSKARQMEIQSGDITMLHFPAGRGDPVQAYNSKQIIGFQSKKKETSGPWSEQRREDQLLAHSVAPSISKTHEASGDITTLEQLGMTAEMSYRSRSQASAAMFVETPVLTLGARLYDQSLVDLGF